MAINDPYDRSGQYTGGDTGPKVDGFGRTAPDQRDHAIGAMMGEAGHDSASGYGAVLDSIQNRMDAINQGANYGTFGNATHQDVVMARGGREYNAMSAKFGGKAYGTAMRGVQGTPKAGVEQERYDLARDVYDSYYSDPNNPYRGAMAGGTFYQRDYLQDKKVGAFQTRMQDKYGAALLGDGYHVGTGPGLWGGGFGYDQLGAGPMRDRLEGPFAPTEAAHPTITTEPLDVITGNEWDDGLEGWDDDLTFAADVIQQTAAPAPIKGSAGVSALGRGGFSDDLTDGLVLGGYGDDMLGRAWTDDLGQPLVGARAAGPAYAGFAGDPGAAFGIGGGTTQGPNGTVNYGTGAQAFGPNDPFGGIGYNAGADPGGGRTDVVDSFDPNGRGPAFSDSGWQDSPEAADRAAGVGFDPGAWGRMGGFERVDDLSSRGGGDGGTGNTGMGEGGTRGDGSYSDSAGRNDNSPQGIL